MRLLPTLLHQAAYTEQSHFTLNEAGHVWILTNTASTNTHTKGHSYNYQNMTRLPLSHVIGAVGYGVV